MPYVGPILKALVSKLRTAAVPLIIHPSPQGTHMQKGAVQGGGETGVMASVLATTGELARVAGANLRPHIGDILPLIIEAIGHPSGPNKSVVAVVTLGQERFVCREIDPQAHMAYLAALLSCNSWNSTGYPVVVSIAQSVVLFLPCSLALAII